MTVAGRIERMNKLRAHLKSRRGRRDFQAVTRYVDLKDNNPKHTTLRSMDSYLRLYYNIESVQPDFGSVVFSQMVRRDDYIFKANEDHMVRAICPSCEELVEITPNGANPLTTFRRQRLVLHPDKRSPGNLCPGGGKDV